MPIDTMALATMSIATMSIAAMLNATMSTSILSAYAVVQFSAFILGQIWQEKHLLLSIDTMRLDFVSIDQLTIDLLSSDSVVADVMANPAWTSPARARSAPPHEDTHRLVAWWNSSHVCSLFPVRFALTPFLSVPLASRSPHLVPPPLSRWRIVARWDPRLRLLSSAVAVWRSRRPHNLSSVTSSPALVARPPRPNGKPPCPRSAPSIRFRAFLAPGRIVARWHPRLRLLSSSVAGWRSRPRFRAPVAAAVFFSRCCCSSRALLVARSPPSALEHNAPGSTLCAAHLARVRRRATPPDSVAPVPVRSTVCRPAR